MSDPNVTFLADAHIYHYPNLELKIVLDRFYEDKEGLRSEIEVTTSLQPRPGLIYHGKISLGSGRIRTETVNAIKKRTTPDWHGETDFTGILEYICYHSVKRWREGDPCIDLRDVDISDRPRWLLEPYVEFGGATILFADGGSGKSTIALAMAAAVSSGKRILGYGAESAPVPALYLDWEADEYIHAERLRALACGFSLDKLPPIFYRRIVASLAESAAAIRKEIATLGIGFVVLDSMGAARCGEPESAETTIRLFAAARGLGVPWIGVDHVTKDSKSKDKPFGSVFAHNLARRTWALEKVQEEGDNTLIVSLTNKKANNGKLAKRQTYRMSYEGTDERVDRITIDSCDYRTVPDLVERSSLRDRILFSLKQSNKTVQELTLSTGAKADQVRARLRELRANSMVAASKEGDRWSLSAWENPDEE